MQAQKKYYSKEYKLKAVFLCHQRTNMSSVALELGLRPDMLSRWGKEYSQDQEKALIKEIRVVCEHSKKKINT